MIRPPECLLHIGAPKCGSSALQAALSHHPDLRAADGTRLRYLVPARRLGAYSGLLSSRALRVAANRAPHGYLCWPDPGHSPGLDYWGELAEAIRRTRSRGRVPILSHENWIGAAERFDKAILGPLDLNARVLAFLRPPLDWLNAAYWQWGVWHGLSFETWVARAGADYRLGRAAARWAELDRVRFEARPLSGDVVAEFAALTGTDLPSGAVSNITSPPALIGFLLRNRRFRPSIHRSYAEGVIQRWCVLPGGPRLWAPRRGHLAAIGPVLEADTAALMEALPEGQRAAFEGDPRWRGLAAYDDRLEGPAPDLSDPAALVALHTALCDGVAAAARAARLPMPALSGAPGPGAAIWRWDRAVAGALEALLDLHRAALASPAVRLLARLRPDALSRGFGPPGILAALAPPDLMPLRPAGGSMTDYQHFLGRRDPALTARFAPSAPPAVSVQAPAPTLLLTGGAGVGADRLIPALTGGWEAADAGALAEALVETPQGMESETLADWLARRTARDGNSGSRAEAALLRVGPRDLQHMARDGALEALAPVRVVRLRRIDPLAWAAAAVLESAQEAGAGGDPFFDAEAIVAAMEARRDAEAMEDLVLSMMLGALDLEITSLDWESFVARPRLHLARIAAFAGLTPRPGGPGPERLLPERLSESARVAVFAQATRARLREALG